MRLEMRPSWCRAGKLGKLWDSLSELRSSVCEKRLEKTILGPALLSVKTAQFTKFSVSMTSHSKILRFKWDRIWRLRGVCVCVCNPIYPSCHEHARYYEAYSESKNRIAVTKSSKLSYKSLLFSDSTFFKLFFHIFDAIIEAPIVAGHKFMYTLLIECGRLRC